MEKIKDFFATVFAYVVVGLILGSPLLLIASFIFFTWQTFLVFIIASLFFGHEKPSPPANDYERGLRDGYANGHDDGYFEGSMDEWITWR